MKDIEVDVAVIGVGSAGLNAYHAAKKRSASVLTIQYGPYGTTCARVGCMPSKLLIAAAEVAHTAKHGEKFGVACTANVDKTGVMLRLQKDRDNFVSSVVNGSVKAISDCDKIEGFAHFIDNNHIRIDDHTTVKFKSAVIATGSKPAVPPLFESAGDRLLTTDQFFELKTLPESIVVFGPGVIGLELGQALARLGVRVRLFGIGKELASISDPTVKDIAYQIFAEEFYLDTDANVSNIEKIGAEIIITFIDKNGEEKIERFDYLLAATGRMPNVQNIGLENTSLRLDKRGVPLHDTNTMQCGDSNIFIAGDANNNAPLLHEAKDEGKIAGANAATYPQVESVERKAPLAIVFSDPQIAFVGMKYADIQDCNYVVGSADFKSQGRSKVMLKNRGIMSLYADKDSGRFLGSEMAVPAAEHIAHLLAWSYQQRLTIEQMLDMPFYHPVVEEGLQNALNDLLKQLK